jgi:hypothetical protein
VELREEFMHKEVAPWDDSQCRPRQADCRSTLQANGLAEEYSQPPPMEQYSRGMRILLQCPFRIAWSPKRDHKQSTHQSHEHFNKITDCPFPGISVSSDRLRQPG